MLNNNDIWLRINTHLTGTTSVSSSTISCSFNLFFLVNKSFINLTDVDIRSKA